MFDWLRRRPLIPAEDALWILDVYAWLLSELGGGLEGLRKTPLVLATPEFFQVDAQGTHARAQQIFAQVRQHAGLEAWPMELVPQAQAPSTRELMPGYAFGTGASQAGAAGTFRFDPKAARATITYAPAELEYPPGFVATMAHELAHYLLLGATRTPPPGGDDAEEPATDVAVHFMGFGVFAANSVVRLSKYQKDGMHGWSVGRVGYLGEEAHAFALAVFLHLRGLPYAHARPHLGPNARAFVRRALRELERDYAPTLAALRQFTAAPAPEASEPAPA